jgi:hypothetical protein
VDGVQQCNAHCYPYNWVPCESQSSCTTMRVAYWSYCRRTAVQRACASLQAWSRCTCARPHRPFPLMHARPVRPRSLSIRPRTSPRPVILWYARCPLGAYTLYRIMFVCLQNSEFPNQNCTWTAFVTEGKQGTLLFKLDTCRFSANDSLTIYDGASQSAPMLNT